MKRYLLILTGFIYTSLFLYGEEVYSLQRCIEIGLQQNYEIQITRNNQQIVDNNYTLGNAGYLPELDLNAGYSGTLNNTEYRYPETNETLKNNGIHNQTLNAGVNLNWTIFDGFNIQASYNRLGELQQMGELNTRLTIENFVAELAAEYYNYIQQTLQMRNLKNTVKLSEERVRIVEARYHIGAASRLDFQQAKVDFNSDSSMLVQQNEVVYRSRIRLNQLMALDNVEQRIMIPDTLIEVYEFLDRDIILNDLLTQNTLLKLYQKDVNLSELDLKIAQSQNYPYLRLNAGYGYTRNTYETGSYDLQQNLGLNYGLTLGYTLFDGGNKRRRQKNARLEIQNKELLYNQLELTLRGDFSNMWMAYRNNIELKNLEKENLETAKETYEIAMERYKLGDLSGLELREIQNRLLEAEERLVKAEYNTKLCEISLLQISGQILSYLYAP
ncbi:MAG: TolC family protein [Candidatus Azobacteroides sp.]|nr:TolC family protein [Candidatus Azobacteroides sp.]